ncbi:MAG: hypothetical protein ACXVP0_06285 [Bacteroidia bacterium]
MLKCPQHIFLLLITILFFSIIPGARAETTFVTAGTQHISVLKGKASTPDCFDFFIATIDDDDDDSVYGKRKAGKCISEPVNTPCFVFSHKDFVMPSACSSGLNGLRHQSPLPSSLLLYTRCLRI